MGGDLPIERFEHGVAQWVVEGDRDHAPAWDEPDCGEDGPRTGQDRVVGANEVDGRGQWPAPDESPDPGLGVGVAEGQQAQSARHDALRQPAGRGEADAAVGVVEEIARPVERGRPGGPVPRSNVIPIGIML
jgi:hypothetical protein